MAEPIPAGEGSRTATARRLLAVLLAALLGLAACTSREASEAPKRAPDPLNGGIQVRVRILQRYAIQRAVVDLSEGTLQVHDEQGKPIPQLADARKLYLMRRGDRLAVGFDAWPEKSGQPTYAEVRLDTVRELPVIFKIYLPDLGWRRQYEGSRLRFMARPDRLGIINRLPLELYIARVLPAEMDPDHFTEEALKAQAVVARSWALKNRTRHQRFGYDFCDSTHCQVYRGRELISRRAEHAVRATLGEVLTFQGHLAEAFYHSTCGGNTVFVHELWGGEPISYLSRVEDRWKPGARPYCNRSPYAHWKVRISRRRLQQALRAAKLLSKNEVLQDIKLDFVNLSGRVQKVLLVTDRTWRGLDVNTFRRLVNRETGRARILSTFFEVGLRDGLVVIEGKGLGHGVGLCQWGARGMAQYGFDYREILAHYFRGTAVEPGYGRPSTQKVMMGSR